MSEIKRRIIIVRKKSTSVKSDAVVSKSTDKDRVKAAPVPKVSAEKLKKNSILKCKRCDRTYKLKPPYIKHVRGCKGKKARGGARDGAGRPEGSQNETTRQRMIVKGRVIEGIMKNADAILNAQLNIALGAHMLFRIKEDKNGNKSKPEMVDDVHTIREFIEQNPGGYEGSIDSDDSTYYFITSKLPDNKAISDMFNRAFGRPNESLQLVDENDKPVPIMEVAITDLDDPDA